VRRKWKPVSPPDARLDFSGRPWIERRMPLFPVPRAGLPALAAFVNAAYRGETSRQGWTHEADYLGGQRTSAQMLAAELAAHPQARLLAWREAPDGPTLGCVWLDPADGRSWKLGMLTVRPDLQAGGLGRRLLAAAEAEAAAGGAGRIGLTVIHIRADLIAWYERRGYVATGAMEPFPYGDDRFGLPMRDDLAFLVMEKAL
jgi:GNAT superfamily N-acetyltransferase